MEEYIESPEIEPTLPKQQSWYSVIIILTLSILYLYLAIKEYPKWRSLRDNFFTKTQKTSKVHSGPTEQKDPLLYIPFIPFAVIYLTLRIIWDTFRLFVFYSLDLIEAGLIALWHLLIRVIKIIPKICAALPSFWETYIQKPFLKFLLLWSDRMYIYVWPVVKITAITTWDISVIAWKEGKKATIYSWNFLVDYSKIGWDKIIVPSLDFMSWAIITFLFEPGKWILDKMIYLGRIAWYCGCFLARDLAEDFRELLLVGWKISVVVFDNALRPAGKFIVKTYEKTKYYLPILREILYTRLMLAAVSEATYLVCEICRDPIFRGCVERIYSMIQSPTLYNFISKHINNIIRHLQIIKPKLINRMRQCGLRLTEFLFTSAVEMASSMCTYYNIILPIIIRIPTIYNEFKRTCNEFYRNIRDRTLKVLKSLWTLFAPLLRPVILALSLFYTTVILSILLSVFRMANWIVSISTTAFNETIALLQRGLSASFSILRSMYNVLSPHVLLALQTARDLIYDLYIRINDLMAEYFPSVLNYLTGVVSRQAQIFKEYTMSAYEKYGPAVIELRDRIKVTADEAVFGIGQSMLEWVKNEKALKEGNHFKNE